MICCLCSRTVYSNEQAKVVDLMRTDELWLTWMTKQLNSYTLAMDYLETCCKLVVCLKCWMPDNEDWRDSRHLKMYDPVMAMQGMSGGDNLA